MKIRTRLKKAWRQIENQRQIILGLERGNRYLHHVCEKIRADMGRQIREEESRNTVMQYLLAGCVLAAGGEITVQTDNLGRLMEEYEIEYGADIEKHTATICMKKKD